LLQPLGGLVFAGPNRRFAGQLARCEEGVEYFAANHLTGCRDHFGAGGVEFDRAFRFTGFLGEFAKAYGRKPKELSKDAVDALVAYHWPGNVRELRNLMERIVILHPQHRIEAWHLPLETAKRGTPKVGEGFGSLQDVKEAAERDYILRKLDETGGNVTRAAELLGLERSNLYRKMKSLGILTKEAERTQ